MRKGLHALNMSLQPDHCDNYEFFILLLPNYNNNSNDDDDDDDDDKGRKIITMTTMN